MISFHMAWKVYESACHYLLKFHFKWPSVAFISCISIQKTLYKPFHVVGTIFSEVILGQKFVMIFRYTNFLLVQSRFFLSLPVKKVKNDKFSSQNNITKWCSGQHEQVLYLHNGFQLNVNHNDCCWENVLSREHFPSVHGEMNSFCIHANQE